MSDSKDQPRLASGSALLAASRVWSQATGAILFLVASKAIGPTDFGEFAIATSIYFSLSVFVGHGAYEYVIKSQNSETAAPTALLINFMTAVAASLGSLLISLVVPFIIPGENVPHLLQALIPAFFVGALVSSMESVVMKHGRAANVAITNLVAETAALVLSLIALTSGLGIFALVVQRITRESVMCLMYFVSNTWRVQILFDREEAGRIIAFARGIIGSRSIGLGATALVDLSIGTMMGVGEAGLFRLVSRVLTFGGDVLFQPFRAAMWVTLPRLQDDSEAFSRRAFQMLEVFGLGLFAVMGGAALISADLFPIALGDQWNAAAPIVAILAINRMLSLPGTQSEVVFALKGRMSTLMKTTTASLVFSLVAVFVAAPYGVIAYAFAILVVTIAMQIYQISEMSTIIATTGRNYMHLLLRLSVPTVAMSLVVLPILRLTGERQGQVDTLLYVAASVVVGAIAFIVSARFAAPYGYGVYRDGVLAALRKIAGTLRRQTV